MRSGALPHAAWRWSIRRANAGMCEAVACNRYSHMYAIVKQIERLSPFSTKCPFGYALGFEAYCGAEH